ncbi:MAG: cytochrome c oxidase subunit II [Candidatus Krumholzibacteriia bacterium]
MRLLNTLFGHWDGAMLAQTAGSFWMPRQGTALAGEVDSIFDFILWLSLFFFTLIVGLMIVFIVRYRQRRRDELPETSPSHNTALELTWTLVPVALVVVIFTVGFRGYLRLTVTPTDSYEVLVTAQKWNWQFTYPNGYSDPELHVPAGKPVRLVMSSQDVIHSFFVPDFRVKRDVVPGRYSKVWFEADEPGEHAILCAEFCGTGHSDMLSKVIVQPQAEFDAWLDNAGGFLDKLPPAEAGERVTRSLGCNVCHSSDGRRLAGPTYKGLFGHEVKLRDGSTVIADEDYIRNSILDPQGQVVEGFDPVMPTFQGRINDKEITVIIAYIKSLSE